MAETTKPAVVKTALPKEIFAVEVPNHELLKLAYDSYLANARLATRGISAATVLCYAIQSKHDQSVDLEPSY